MDDEKISEDKYFNMSDEKLSKNEMVNNENISTNENNILYKERKFDEGSISNNRGMLEEKLANNKDVNEGNVPNNKDVDEGNVPNNKDVDEGNVPNNKNVDEESVPNNKNVDEGNVPNDKNVDEEHAPDNKNTDAEKVPKNENTDLREAKTAKSEINLDEKAVPKSNYMNVDEKRVPKSNYMIVDEKRVPKSKFMNVDEKRVSKRKIKNMGEEKATTKEIDIMNTENISTNENKNTSEKILRSKENRKASKKEKINKKPLSRVRNADMDASVSKHETISLNEGKVHKHLNVEVIKTTKDENVNLEDEKMSKFEDPYVKEEKIKKRVKKINTLKYKKYSIVKKEMMPKNKRSGKKKTKTNAKNFSVNKENLSKARSSSEGEKLSAYENPDTVHENETKEENPDIVDQKSKSCTDEKDKESATSILSDTLRACLPKSSDPGTVSVALPPPEDTSSTVSNSSLDDDFERGTWSRQLDFFLSCVGYAVGLGNIWRFPYLCYRSGGGAFLIPYLIFLLICGMPLFFLEMSFGQFASLGPIAIWKICPLFKGLGYGMVIISAIVCIYYNVIIAWTLYYIYQSIHVPWKTCTNLWNTENCIDSSGSTVSSSVNSSTFFNDSSSAMLNVTMLVTSNENRTTSSQEFWLRHVLRQSSGIDSIGELQLPLVLTLFLAWFVVFLCLQKGVKSSGKVVYFSATFPYVILVILMIRGLTLPGAWKGIAFYLSPRWEKLMTFKVWADAATQIFYSVGAAWGAILTMASYNKFSNNVYRDSLLIPLINCGTSIFAGFVVFAIIGFMAYETGKPIDRVVDEGPGLAFIVYPEAVARLPLSPIWAILFFIMLFTIGLDSQFGMFETAVSAFVDEFPSFLKKRKTLFTAFLCFVLFILGLPCVTQGGIYILQLMDWYSATFSLMIISLLETVVISHIYGIKRFMADITLMIKKQPPFWWKLCWCFITPGTIISLLVFIFVNHQPVTYDKYVYPEWSIVVGWLIAFVSIVPIPLVAILQIAKAEGTLKERLLFCLTPSPEWGPALEENRILYKKSLAVVASNFPQKNFSGLAHSVSHAHIVEESGLCMVQKDESADPSRESSV